jgi:TadE-like protein.
MIYRARNVTSRKRRGGAIVETVAGLFVFIPVVLFIVDVVAMVLAQMAHDALAKDAARAAADTTDVGQATSAMNTVRGNFNSPVMVVNSMTLDAANWPNSVRVESISTFTFPVSIPFLGVASQRFVAEAVEPVVGVVPQ